MSLIIALSFGICNVHAKPKKLGKSVREKCRGSSTVTVYQAHTKTPWVKAKKGKTFIKKPKSIVLTDKLYWKCGKSWEKTSVPNGANKLKFEYHGDGTIWFKFYRDGKKPDEITKDYCRKSVLTTFNTYFEVEDGKASAASQESGSISFEKKRGGYMAGIDLTYKKDFHPGSYGLWRWACGGLPKAYKASANDTGQFWSTLVLTSGKVPGGEAVLLTSEMVKSFGSWEKSGCHHATKFRSKSATSYDVIWNWKDGRIIWKCYNGKGWTESKNGTPEHN